ncbi:MAG: L-threonylcarbamoyladenylate synthase [Deltaproteobacteria bacterium]|nr:L-threonylcarbamoyladenylate synthase [Deltaproteobacteria bacterium]
MKAPVLKADSKGIARASRIILQGGIVAFPTETFYGLGADAGDVVALQKVFQIKGREENKPLLLLVAGRTWVQDLVKKISPAAEALIERFWPGPLTLVFEASAHLPPILTANTGKVGLRASSHPVTQALVQAVGRAITGTSANLSGQASPSLAAQVSQALGKKVDAILDGGKTAGGLGSTVLDVSAVLPKIIRQGAISQEELAPFLEAG